MAVHATHESALKRLGCMCCDPDHESEMDMKKLRNGRNAGPAAFLWGG